MRGPSAFAGGSLFLVTIGLLSTGAPSQAQTWTGAGPNDFWTTGTNWQPGTPPANDGSAQIVFSGGPRTNPDLDADYSIASLQFIAGASSFVLGSSGGHTLTVGGLISNGDITSPSLRNSPVNPQTINLALALSRNTLLAGVSTSAFNYTSLTLNGPINTNGFSLNFSTPNDRFVINGPPLPIFINGAIGGSGGIAADTVSGYVDLGALTLTAANPYTGATILNGSRQISLTGNAAALTGTSTIALTGGARVFVGDAASTAASPNRLNDAAALSLGRGEFVLTGTDNAAITRETIGTITLNGGGGILTVQPATSSRQAELASTAPLARSPGGTGLVRGPGGLGADPAAGTARVFFGTAPTLVGGGGAAGTHNVSIVPYLVGGTSVTDRGSTLLTYGANGLRTLDVNTEFASSIASSGATDNVRVTTAETVGASRTINSLILNSVSGNPSPVVTMNSATTLTVSSGVVLITGSGGLNGAGTLNFGAAQGVITSLLNTGASNTILSVITGSGGLTLSGTALVLEGNSSYTGTTYLNTTVTARNSTTALGASGPGNDVVFNEGGSLNFTGGGILTKDLRGGAYGFAPTMNINAAGTINGSITAAEPGQLPPGVAPGVSTIALGGAVTVTGDIVGARFAAASAFNVNAGTGRMTLNGVLRDGAAGVPMSLNVSSTGSGSVVALNGANTFTGATSVLRGGTLLVNGSIVGGGNVTTQAAAELGAISGRLGGNGRIDPANGSVVLNAGTINPGDPLLNGGVGTLTIGSAGSENNLGALANSTFEFQLGASSDKLVVFGGLDLGGSRIFVDLFDAGGATVGLYTVIDYSTTLSGSFDNFFLNIVPPGWQATLVNDVANTAVEVRLTTVPEPGSTALLLLGGGTLTLLSAFVRRRRAGTATVRATAVLETAPRSNVSTT